LTRALDNHGAPSSHTILGRYLITQRNERSRSPQRNPASNADRGTRPALPEDETSATIIAEAGEVLKARGGIHAAFPLQPEPNLDSLAPFPA
jgi:hypothetical protein